MKRYLLLFLVSPTLASADAGAAPSYPAGFYRNDAQGWITSAPGSTIQESGPGRSSPLVYPVTLELKSPKGASAGEIRAYAFYHDACARALAHDDGAQFRFSTGEFKDIQQAKDLLAAVRRRATGAIATPSSPLAALNALLDRMDLHKLVPLRLTLSDSMRDLAETLDKGLPLPKGQLLALNRVILESEFPDVAPQLFSTCGQIGHFDFRPLALGSVKAAIESYFSAKATGSSLRKVVSSQISEDDLRFVQVITAEYVQPATPGPMGIPAAREMREERYYVGKESGLVVATERPVGPKQ